METSEELTANTTVIDAFTPHLQLAPAITITPELFPVLITSSSTAAHFAHIQRLLHTHTQAENVDFVCICAFIVSSNHTFLNFTKLLRV